MFSQLTSCFSYSPHQLLLAPNIYHRIMPAKSLSIRGGLFHGIDDHHFFLPSKDYGTDVQPLLTTVHPQSTIALRRSCPSYEITEDKDGYMVAIDVVGVKPKDIKVSLEHGGKVLRVSGHKHMHRGDNPVESRFDKTFTVHTNVDSSGISANIHGGILIISCPKIAAATTRNIPLTQHEHLTTGMFPILHELTHSSASSVGSNSQSSKGKRNTEESSDCSKSSKAWNKRVAVAYMENIAL